MSNPRNKTSPMIYGVIICRTDGEHIMVVEDPDYDKCFAKWQETYTNWQTSAKEQQPFVLTAPVVTAFAPALIYEIKLLPTNAQENASKTHNPYNSMMNEQGFSRTFPSRGGADLL